MPNENAGLTPRVMSNRQIEMSREIMDLLRIYRGTFDEKSPFIWIEDNETGEFMVYTLGESRSQIKEALGRL